VHYSDYDGGGHLTHALVGTEALPEEQPQREVHAEGKTAEGARGPLRAPARRRAPRESARSASASGGPPEVAAGEAQAAGPGPASPSDDGADPAPGPARSGDDGDEASGASDGSSADDLFDKDAAYPTGWSTSSFVRAWGVLTSWLSDFAVEVLRGSRAERSEEGRPAHRGRRGLVTELLSARLPGDLTFLAARFHEVVSALSVHQTLPSVTESALYDLLAALLLRSVYRVDVRRGLVAESSHCTSLLDHQVEAAARTLSIADSELQVLDGMLA